VTGFSRRCGLDDERRRHGIAQVTRLIESAGIELVRFVW
jgi:hypothetical protein